MPRCLYCDQPAGPFRRKHKRCEQSYLDDWNALVDLALKAATGELTPGQADEGIESILRSSFFDHQNLRKALTGAFGLAVDQFLESGTVGDKEAQNALAFKDYFSLTVEELDSDFMRLVQGRVLSDIDNGLIPDRLDITGEIPFNFQRSEWLAWLFPNTVYSRDSIEREHHRGVPPTSVRIAKGVSLSVGGRKSYTK